VVDRLEPGDPERIGEFWLAGRLGAGGQGVVYEAYGPDGGRVAVKVLHGASASPRELERMAAEARAAQRVASFCTARILQVRLEPPRPYIVSEYIDGLSLQAAVEGGDGRVPRRFGGDDLHRLGIGIATALTAIHQSKVVHRDLKPGNVMLGPDGPRLIDFGVARVLDTGSATRDRGLVGTLRYLPPEVYAGQRAGAEADVFAWGAIMVFAATGRPAFTGGDLPQIAHQVRTCDPDLSALPDALRALVATALAKDPLQRPSASQILAALTGDPRQGDGDLGALIDRGAELAGPPSGWAPGDPALGKLSEDAYTTLPPDDRYLVAEVFLRCLVPGEDESWSVRPVPAAELFERPDPAEGEALQRVVQAFAPLLALTDEAAPNQAQDPTQGQMERRAGQQVVLARPAVLRAWPRLRDWAQDRRQELAAHHRVRQSARVWDEHGQRRSDVLTGAHLDQALQWITTGRRPFPNRVERALLDASTRAQTIRTRRTRTVALVLAVTTLLSLTATGWAIRAQQNANRQRDALASSQLIARSQQSTDSVVSSQLAAAAWRLQESPESRAALVNVLANPHQRADFTSRTSSVTSVAFSPDGNILAAGGVDGAVQLWDVRKRHRIGQPLTRHTSSITSVAFSPKGNILATSSDDNTVRLWNVGTRNQIGQPLTGDNGGVSSVAFSPDGNTLATNSAIGMMQLWDVGTRSEIGEAHTANSDGVVSVAFSPNSNTLAISGEDGTVRLWNVRTNSQIGQPLTHADSGGSMAFSQDGKILATNSNDNTVRLWDVGTRSQIGAPLTGHTEGITSVAFSPDGNTVATSSDDGTARLWDVRTRRQVGQALTGHTGPVRTVVFSPKGNTLATGSVGGAVQLWDVGVHRQTGAPLTGHTDPVRAVAFSPKGNILATGSNDGTARLWNVNTRSRIGQPLTGHNGYVHAVAFSPDGNVLATSTFDNKVRLWNVGDRSRIGQILTYRDSDYSIGVPVYSMAFSPKSNILATGSEDGTVQLFDVGTRSQIGRSLTGHKGHIASMTFSPDANILATSSYDNTVRLWNVRDRSRIGQLRTRTGYVYSVAFSPKGNTLATSSNDGTARLWNAGTRRQIGQPFTHTGSVYSVAFSPDGNTLATSSNDSTVRLWDVATRRQLGAPLTGHTAPVSSVAFSRDGNTLATSSGDKTVQFWDVSMPADLFGSVCAVAGRTLTPQEWAQYVPAGIEYRKVCP
jgi:WD40 repeat protein